MKRLVGLVSVLGCVLGVAVLATSLARGEGPAYRGSRFEEVWSAVVADPYDELPAYRVTVSSFFGWLENRLLTASRRTLSDRSDLLPRFRKLLHPNGICLSGRWRITEDTPYTGYFAQGSEGLIIARASAALSETKQGQPRAFGLAGKLYPTTDAAHVEPLQTANFFTIEDLGGTYRPYFLDAENTNDIIQISLRPSGVFKGPLAAVVANAFSTADETLNISQTLIRQLYPIAQLGEAEGTETVAPRWMKLVGSAVTPRVSRRDFRDELDMQNYPDGIYLDVLVASEGKRLGDKDWVYIGEIHLTESVVSDSCDSRLHFTHPPFRS